jgi:hypothetical protein
VEAHGQDSHGHVNIARYDANTTVNAAFGQNPPTARSLGRRSNGHWSSRPNSFGTRLISTILILSLLRLAEEDFGFRVAVRGD